MAEQQRKRL